MNYQHPSTCVKYTSTQRFLSWVHMIVRWKSIPRPIFFAFLTHWTYISIDNMNSNIRLLIHITHLSMNQLINSFMKFLMPNNFFFITYGCGFTFPLVGRGLKIIFWHRYPISMNSMFTFWLCIFHISIFLSIWFYHVSFTTHLSFVFLLFMIFFLPFIHMFKPFNLSMFCKHWSSKSFNLIIISIFIWTIHNFVEYWNWNVCA